MFIFVMKTSYCSYCFALLMVSEPMLYCLFADEIRARTRGNYCRLKSVPVFGAGSFVYVVYVIIGLVTSVLFCGFHSGSMTA